MPIGSLQVQAQSYRYLRVVIVGLLVALATAVFYQTVTQDSFLSSVSAYYYTSAQAVFVGALIGLGACMIALQGMTGAEDTLLNLGGICAIVVAIIPTGRGADFQTAVQACSNANRGSPSPDCLSVPGLQAASRANVETSVAALLVVGGLALLLSAGILLRDRKKGTGTARAWALAGFLTAVAAWGCGLVALLVFVDWLAGHAHYIAALGLLLSIAAVAAANAHRRQEKPTLVMALKSPHKFSYTWIAVTMLAGSVILVALWLAGAITLFWVEILVALLFIAFWITQTVELETGGDGRPPAGAGPQCARPVAAEPAG